MPINLQPRFSNSLKITFHCKLKNFQSQLLMFGPIDSKHTIVRNILYTVLMYTVELVAAI